MSTFLSYVTMYYFLTLFILGTAAFPTERSLLNRRFLKADEPASSSAPVPIPLFNNGGPLSRYKRQDIAAEAQELANALKSGYVDVYEDLKDLVDVGPSRMAGTEGGRRAASLLEKKMKGYGFHKVSRQPVEVPCWKRGRGESAIIIPSPQALRKWFERLDTASDRDASGQRALASADMDHYLDLAAMTLSVGTDGKPLEAPVLEVSSLDEVIQNGPSGMYEGKIVFFNIVMSPQESSPDQYDAYIKGAAERLSGPSTAARFGAVATLVRSASPLIDRTPHIERVLYDPKHPKIPAAVLSTHSSNVLSAALKEDAELTLSLLLPCEFEVSNTTKQSYNIIAEIKGRELPHEHVVVAAHWDTVDAGSGAQDDASGVAQIIGVGRAIILMGLRPRRTIKIVALTGEELGGLGGAEFARHAKLSGEEIVAAVESDRGAFVNLGFSFDPTDSRAEPLLTRFAPFLAQVNATMKIPQGTGTEISWLKWNGAVCFSLAPDSYRYFELRHSTKDKPETVDRRLLQWGASALGVLTYLLAEMP